MPIKKVAVFLMILGVEKGHRIIELMDNGEIRAIVPQIRRLTVVSPEIQEEIWAEFNELGYDDKLKPTEVLTIIRFLFNKTQPPSPCLCVSSEGERHL